MSYRILKTETNVPVDFNLFLKMLGNKDLIYIGEFHQIPEVLSFQMGIVSGLLHQGIRPALGLEMFNVLQQEILDYYISGVLPFEQLSNLYDMGPEGFDLNHYIHLIEIAAKNNLKIIGLNIPRSIASSVAKQGLDRKEIEGFHLDSREIINCGKKYKKVLSAVYKKHPHAEITEENFILAQSVKDEMMAETIMHYLKNESAGRPLIIITGRGHMESGLGIPERVKKKLSRNKNAKSMSNLLIVTAYEDETISKGRADYALLI